MMKRYNWLILVVICVAQTGCINLFGGGLWSDETSTQDHRYQNPYVKPPKDPRYLRGYKEEPSIWRPWTYFQEDLQVNEPANTMEGFVGGRRPE